MNPAASSPRSGRPPGRSAWLRRIPWIGGAILTALIVAGLWPRPVPVETEAIVRGPLIVTVDEEGMTRVKNRYVVSAPIAGQLRRIDWKAGAMVEAGRTPLAVLEPGGADFLDTRSQAQAQAAVRAAEAARAAAEAQRERARAAARLVGADFDRAKVLREQNVASVQEFETAQARAETAAQETRAAEFAVQVAEFELQQARAVLTRGEPSAQSSLSGEAAAPLIVTSPVSGSILRVFQESARVVPAGFSLMEVGDPTDLEVRIEVLSRDAVAIAPGARVMLEQWGGPAPLKARVRWVEPSAFTKISALGVEEQRVYVIADLTDPVEARATLGDNYRVEARIVTWEAPDAVLAPTGALFQQGGTWRAFALESGRAVRRTLRVGRSNGIQSEILEGLREGEVVIVYPGDKVVEGMRVAKLEIAAR